MNEDFYDEAVENGEEIETFDFFASELSAFLDRGEPGIISIFKYEDKFVLSVTEEHVDDDWMPAPKEFYDYTVFDFYMDAKNRCLELQTKGIKPGKAQIAECLSKVKFSNAIDIQPCDRAYRVDFNVYYGDDLLIEHMRGLYPDYINKCVQTYTDFCEKYGICITSIYKERREWNSNQRYYRMEFTDKTGIEKSYRIHIPSATQGAQRCTIDCIKEKSFEKFLNDKEPK